MTESSMGDETETNREINMKYEGLCENCGVIEFDEHPEGEFGPECPACTSVLRVVQEIDAEKVTDGALSAEELAEARETLELLDAEFETADAPKQSEMVKEAVHVRF